MELIKPILQNALLGAGALACYLALFRDNFRIPVKAAAACAFLYLAISMSIAALTDMSLWYRQADCIAYYSMLLVLLREHQGPCMITQALLVDMLAFLTALFTGLAYGILALCRGGSSWLVMEDAGAGFWILALLLLIPALVITYLVVRLLKPDIMTITGPLKWFLIAILPVKSVVFQLIKNGITDIAAYRNDPSGLSFLADVLDIFLFLLALLIIVRLHVRRVRSTFRAAKAENRTESDSYREEVQELQDTLRQRRHDAAGWQRTSEGGSAEEH